MRDVLALLVGLATSLIGLLVVLGTDMDLVGVALIAAGMAVAVFGRSGIGIHHPGP